MRVLLLFGFCFLFNGLLIFGQKNLSTKSAKAEKLYHDAILKIDRYDLESAILLLQDAIKADKKFVESYLLLGELYNDLDRDSLAIQSFKNGIEVDANVFPPAIANLARLEWNNGLYSDALEHVKAYLALPNIQPNSKAGAEMLLKSCEYAINYIKKPVPFNPQNIGGEINTANDQYWPSLSADEKTFVFTAALPVPSANNQLFNNRQEDFFVSVLNAEGKWNPAKPIGPPLNTAGNEGAQTISADGTIMVFTGCNRKGGVGLCDLYISRKNGEQWSVPKNMGAIVNSASKETQPSISPDGKTVYFSSNRKGTRGGLDLWKTTISDSGVWSAPVNLGPDINTISDEQSPFIHSDNKTLYFSSNGWPGFGRFDLFLSRQISDTSWSVPFNLGYPINSHFTDEGLIVNAKGNTAYYSSTRKGFGGRDIFYFELYKEAQPTPVSYMKGKVYNAETKEPVKARFELIDLATEKRIMDAFSGEDGTFVICIPSGKNYALNVNKIGYLFFSDNFTMREGDFIKPFTKDIPLEPLKAGSKVILKNIFFDHDSYTLKPESKSELSKLYILLKENKLIKIEISGHTDNTGAKEYNLKLSENRAKSVVDYLTEKGVESNRILSKGFGDTQPITTDNSVEGRATNRRTEFKVIGL